MTISRSNNGFWNDQDEKSNGVFTFSELDFLHFGLGVEIEIPFLGTMRKLE